MLSLCMCLVFMQLANNRATTSERGYIQYTSRGRKQCLQAKEEEWDPHGTKVATYFIFKLTVIDPCSVQENYDFQQIVVGCN